MMKFDANEVLGHVCYAIRNAKVNLYPFPHFFIENVFPDDFYHQLISNLPPHDDYASGVNHYNGRKFADPAATGELGFLLSQDFLHSVISTFRPHFLERFPSGKFIPKQDLRLILDSENYAIGPHTDAPWKVVSLLFYLPCDFELESLGTSIYIPKDRSFTCPGGPHHKFPDFTRIYTAPFIPNSLFGFFKTSDSFHGVEPIKISCRRDVLLWNLYDKGAPNGQGQGT